jgi:hypothetical protein
MPKVSENDFVFFGTTVAAHISLSLFLHCYIFLIPFNNVAPNEFQQNYPELATQMRDSWRQAWPNEFAY